MKCKKSEVQGRLRKDREGGLRPKHALECLRHGADLSAYGKFRTVPGRWVKVLEECYEEGFAAVWMHDFKQKAMETYKNVEK